MARKGPQGTLEARRGLEMKYYEPNVLSAYNTTLDFERNGKTSKGALLAIILCILILNAPSMIRFIKRAEWLTCAIRDVIDTESRGHHVYNPEHGPLLSSPPSSPPYSLPKRPRFIPERFTQDKRCRVDAPHL